MEPTTLPSGKTETPQQTLDRARNMQSTVRETAGQAGAAARQSTVSPTFDVQEVETPTTEVRLPEPPRTSVANDLSTSVISSVLDQSQQIESAQANQQELMQQLSSAFGTTVDEAAIADAAGLTAAEDSLVDIRNKVMQKEQKFRRLLEQVDTDQTLSSARKQSRIANIEREQARELADLAVIENAAMNRYSAAQAYVDRKVKSQTEQQRNKVEALKFFYQENKEVLTTAQTRQYERVIARENRKLDREERNLERLENEKLNILRNAQLNGAPIEVLENIQSSNSIDEAMKSAGQFGVDRKAQLQNTLLEEQIKTETAQRSKIYSEIKPGDKVTTPAGQDIEIPTFDEWRVTNTDVFGPLSPTDMAALEAEYEDEIEVMRQAAKVASLSQFAREVVNNPQAYYGFTPTARQEVFEELASAGLDTNTIISGQKKPLPSTQVESLAQARNVKEDVVKLKNMLDGLPGTGPISGRIQALDPYHPQRVAIDAQITRIVPGLARGIFGEVGVLTDSDIERYTNTIANPNMTDQQIEQVHRDTLEKIDQSLNSTIETFGLAGYNVSNFENTEQPDTSKMSDDEAYQEYLRVIGAKQ